MGRAFVFPGQGAQAIGMGKALADEFPVARRVFAEVDDTLGESLSSVIWHGQLDELVLTRNTQPALMATSIAVLRALQSEGVDLNALSLVAGHSVGEYSALCAAGAISVADAARLLRTRGQAMQDAVPWDSGRMAAILGLGFEAVSEIAAEASSDGVCEPANDNDPKQVVLSGDRQAVERAVEIARSRGARRAVILSVSAPFHCRLMKPAAEKVGSALAETEIRKARIPVVSNVLAEPVTDPDVIRELLVTQITATVRWRESIGAMKRLGIANLWELGPGNVLSGMIRRTEPGMACYPVATPEQVRKAASDFMELQQCLS